MLEFRARNCQRILVRRHLLRGGGDFPAGKLHFLARHEELRGRGHLEREAGDYACFCRDDNLLAKEDSIL